jgi:2'-5' RNA ligase
MIETGQPKTERLFIGVPVSADARTAIALALPKNIPGKVVAPDKWHFTLRFLGATSPAVRDALISHLFSVKLGSAFRIQFGEMGAFPKPRRARVLWLGVTRGGERLSGLAAIAEHAASVAGFTPEARRFTPHLTLSRIDPPQSVEPVLQSKSKIDVEMLVDSVILYRSRLGGGPARYEEVERFALTRS